MARRYTCEAVVYIWKYGGPSHPGHAAMKLHNVPGTDRDKVYISFWPESAGKDNAFQKVTPVPETSYFDDKRSEVGEKVLPGILSGRFAPRQGQQVYLRRRGSQNHAPSQWHEWNEDNKQIFSEMSEEQQQRWEFTATQKPHEKIYIPGIGAANCHYGLDLVAIYEWFQVFLNSPELKYKYASKKVNCSGVVLTALLKGGAGKIARKPSALMYIDPNQVHSFATKVAAKIEKWNQDGHGVVIPTPRPSFVNSQAVDLPTLAQWKLATNLGMFASRKHVEKIDQAIEAFEKGKGGEQHLELIGNLLKAVREHMMKYPLSRRGGAVLELGKDAVHLLRYAIQNFDMPEPDWVNDYI